MNHHAANPRHNAATLAALYEMAQGRLAARLALVKVPFGQMNEWLLVSSPSRHCERTRTKCVGARQPIAPKLRSSAGGSITRIFHQSTSQQFQEVDCFASLAMTGNKPPNLITSCLMLQGSDNIAEELSAIHAALDGGGLFLGVLIGGNTFHELRTCLMEAEIALAGGASLRVPALPDAATLARQMSAAGFAHSVVDLESVTLVFDDLFALMHELRGAGCANYHGARQRTFAPRALFANAAALYAARFPAEDGGITASIDLIFLHGWRE